MDRLGKTLRGSWRGMGVLFIAVPISLFASAYVTTFNMRSCITAAEAEFVQAGYGGLPDRAFNAALVTCYRK